MPTWKSKPRLIRHTTLLVVEGDTEKAFVTHLRSRFGRQCGTRLTIECAYGGSGDAILAHALKLCPGFDRRAVLYDADRPPTSKTLLADAERKKLERIVSTPAIDGVLLSILGQAAPRETADCKRCLADLIADSLTDWRNYARHFPEADLRARAASVPTLAQLLALMNHELPAP
jgi:hypothetical protein